MAAELAVQNVLARGRLIRDLLNGDPVAWTILIGVIAVFIVIAVVKKRMNKQQ